MNNADINKYLHEKILGLCWCNANDSENIGGTYYYSCSKCSDEVGESDSGIKLGNPNYCSDLNAVATAEAKIKEVGMHMYYALCLDSFCAKNSLEYTDAFKLLTASAQIRAECLVKTWQNYIDMNKEINSK